MTERSDFAMVMSRNVSDHLQHCRCATGNHLTLLFRLLDHDDPTGQNKIQVQAAITT
jgi:hypothetical protein